jgi:putative flavoprotein involved in K+ transport
LFFDDRLTKISALPTSFAKIKRDIDAHIFSQGLKALHPEPDNYPMLSKPVPNSHIGDIDSGLVGITTVIWCTGFGADFSWIDLPIFGAFCGPMHVRTDVRGIFITGLQWLSGPALGLVAGVEDDANFIASQISKLL